jgi:FkbM family methyltransferase
VSQLGGTQSYLTQEEMKLINTYTGSYPIVFHAPGSSRTHPFWHGLNEHAETLQPVTMSDDIEIITWSSFNETTVLEDCCDRLNIPLTVLRPTGEWNNLMKVELLIDYLPKSKAKYIVGLDASDIVLIDSPDEIVRRWKEYYPKSKLLYNGGYRQWPVRYCPPTRECDDFERKTFAGSRAKHLNAGAWVGEREYVLDFYKKVKKVEREKLFHTIYRFMEQPSVRAVAFPGHYPELMVDTDSVIFQHMLMGVTDCAYTADYDGLPEQRRLIYYDLGAFDGRTTMNFITAHHPYRAYSFEPVASHLETDYWRTAKGQYADTLRLSDNAVWTKEADIDFYIDTTNAKSQSCTGVEEKKTVETIDRDHPVKVKAIDFHAFFLSRYRKQDYTVMKMDIEGAEYSVLVDMIERDSLRRIDELRIEFHGQKMTGESQHYIDIENRIRDYCKEHNINLVEMDH